MAHNLNEENGNVAFFANIEKDGLPWHRLGQNVIGAKTAKEAMKLAFANWKANKFNLFHPVKTELELINLLTSEEFSNWYTNLLKTNHTTKNIKSEIETNLHSFFNFDKLKLQDTFGVFRSDNLNHIGTVGNVYKPLQNEDAFNFVDYLLEAEGEAHFETAGVLGKGERIFCCVKVPFEVAPDRAPDDKSFCYMFFTNSHDGKSKTMAKLTTIRPVCQNTLDAGISSEGFGELAIKHSGMAEYQLEQAKKMLTGVKQTAESLKKKFDILANKKMTTLGIQKTFEKLFGDNFESTRKQNNFRIINQLFDNNDNNTFPEIKGSAYSFLQSITNYYDHYVSVNVTDNRGTMTKELIRTENSIFGKNSEKKSKAIDRILEVVKDCPPMPKKLVVSVPSIDNILSKVAI